MSSTDNPSIAIIGGGLAWAGSLWLQFCRRQDSVRLCLLCTTNTTHATIWAAVSTCTSSLVWYRCDASCGTEKQFRAAASRPEGESTGVPRATVHHDHRRRRTARRFDKFLRNSYDVHQFRLLQ
ncbi:hypothetical protein C8R43DRAFT_1138477 [Mycena crocata]|nr:hypothetical protein C8R43DRAFT_1138477 [Mycena crocata]